MCGEQRGHRLGVCRATHARKHTRTQRKLREHLDVCHLPRGSHLVYTLVQEGGSSLPGCATFMLACAAGRGWRTEQTGESVQNRMTHFAGIKCLSKHGYCDLGQETRGNAHHRLPPRAPLSGHTQLLDLPAERKRMLTDGSQAFREYNFSTFIKEKIK